MKSKVPQFSTEILLKIDRFELFSQNFINLGELTAEDYCCKIGKQLINRDVLISSKEMLCEIVRYFECNSEENKVYVLMDIVRSIEQLFS